MNEYKVYPTIPNDVAVMIEKLKITADKRLELLRRCAYIYIDGPGGKYVCYFCSADKGDDHAEDCELAKELGDDND